MARHIKVGDMVEVIAGAGAGIDYLAGPVTEVGLVPGWTGGVPDPSVDDCSVDASYRPRQCAILMECEFFYLTAACIEPGRSGYECTCLLSPRDSNTSTLFEEEPYPGDDLDPCIAAMEVCVTL